MTKQQIKDHLIKTQNTLIQDLEAQIESYRKDVIENAEETLTNDENSRNEEYAEKTNRVEQRLVKAKNELAKILEFPLTDHTVVEPGAVLSVNDIFYVVGLSFPNCAIDGVDFIGLTEDSPVYPIIKGKKSGEKYEINGFMNTIKKIF